MSTILATVVTPGTVVDYTPGTAVVGGAVVVQGTLVGVATSDIAAGELGSLMVSGVIQFPKAAAAITAGALVYWDEADGEVNTTASGNHRVGKAIAAAALNSTHVDVFIDQV
jgi:predicted RecA/RadA family phage recombinase